MQPEAQGVFRALVHAPQAANAVTIYPAGGYGSYRAALAAKIAAGAVMISDDLNPQPIAPARQKIRQWIFPAPV